MVRFQAVTVYSWHDNFLVVLSQECFWSRPIRCLMMIWVSVKKFRIFSPGSRPRRQHQPERVDPNTLPLCLSQRHPSLPQRHASLSERHGSPSQMNGSLLQRHGRLTESHGSLVQWHGSVSQMNGSLSERHAEGGGGEERQEEVEC